MRYNLTVAWSFPFAYSRRSPDVIPYSRKILALSFASCSICCGGTRAGVPEEAHVPREEGNRLWAANGTLARPPSTSAKIKTNLVPFIPCPLSIALVLSYGTAARRIALLRTRRVNRRRDLCGEAIDTAEVFLDSVE